MVGVFTDEDLAGDFAAPMPMVWAPPGVEVNTPEHWPLATGEVKHVGDPVAIVIGTDRYGVVDAAEEVIVEYDPLPVVVDPEAALEDGSAADLGRSSAPTRPTSGRSRAATSRRPSPRPTWWSSSASSTTAPPGAAIETRGVRRRPARRARHLLLSATQIPHICALRPVALLRHAGGQAARDRARRGWRLRLEAQRLRRGGARRAGSRAQLERPVKWIETRSENMAATHHGRDQIDYVEIGGQAATARSPASARTSSPTSAPTSCCSRRSSPSSASR